MNCSKLIHPFHTDPGTSQRQRVMNDLLSGTASIDGRTLADLLNYFVELSRHINYYDSFLNVSDWQPFLRKSLPFSLAAMIKYNTASIDRKFERYNNLFDKSPSKQGLQLLVNYFFNNTISKINFWYSLVKGSNLPVEITLEKLIRDKLQAPLKDFILLTNKAVSRFCIKRIDFSKLSANEVWGLQQNNLTCANNDCHTFRGRTRRDKMTAMRNEIRSLFPLFLNAIKISAAGAELSLNQSLIPLKEDLQKQHAPHLGLLFAFLQLFQYLQKDLNGFTRRHLDFFYKEVLKLKPRTAAPDKTHIIVEIQKQLQQYRLKKGLLVKNGKDDNKAEVLFSLDDEIIVNKTQIVDKRSLFLFNHDVSIRDQATGKNENKTFVEGAYMAPDATKADGVEIDFETEENKPASFSTVGAKYSKYQDPETKLFKQYPHARLGFILASPVLLLNEGTRYVTITLACKVDELATCNSDGYPHFISGSALLYKRIRRLAAKGFYYISQELIAQAEKKGIKKTTTELLWTYLLADSRENKCCDTQIISYNYDVVITARKWRLEIYDLLEESEKKILSGIFKERRIFKFSFSGADEWVEASNIRRIRFSALVGDRFFIKIKFRFKVGKPAITFYDKAKLKEDFNTTLPLVKIELDDDIKVFRGFDVSDTPCCMEIGHSNRKRPISLYHFFRNVYLVDDPGGAKTNIEVKVCGLKSLIVQNDESIQDVNSPIFPFGTRPRVNASFYIGSKELFSKDWRQVYINAEWKDKPVDLGEHYKHYSYKITTFEDDTEQIVNSSFLTSAYVLDRGVWRFDGKRRLFKKVTGELPRDTVKYPLPAGFPPVPTTPETPADFCMHGILPANVDVYDYGHTQFNNLSAYERRTELSSPLLPYNVSSQYGFIRLTLEGISFQHDKYPFVLARHMMAYAGLLSLDIIQKLVAKAKDAKKIIDKMVIKIGNINTHIGHIQGHVNTITALLVTINNELVSAQADIAAAALKLPGDPVGAATDVGNAAGHVTNIVTNITSLAGKRTNIQSELNLIVPDLTGNLIGPFNVNSAGLIRLAAELKAIIEFFVDKLKVDPELKDGLPSEPYTPVMKTLSLDYVAIAENTDIDLIHLYPYTGTYKSEEITLQPPILPTFCDEGTLFLGLKDLVPGNNVNILFQLAEATSDSEFDPETIQWYYLDNNQWKSLRTGFEIINDATEDLTSSGIVKFALPPNMTKENTILPKGLHWIKASIKKHSLTVCETIGIHTQAISVTFTNDEANDKLRLSKPLKAKSVTKLDESDANVKKIEQPYESTGGRVPETEGHFYVRTSEWLRHKGRAIQKFDYERLTLEKFPKLYKVKCISHSYALNAYQYKSDFPVAPGYVLLAVIPDLFQLKGAESFEPKAPVSMLDAIQEYFKKISSPFVRLRATNPRYEKIHFCLKVKLVKGRDENYYKDKLERDIREFIAPWAVGKYDKLTFGQCVNRSDIIRFIESRDYIDFIVELIMRHDTEKWPDKNLAGEWLKAICPKTPRSILVAGDIDICIAREQCEEWQKCYADENEQREVDCCETKRILIANYCQPEKR